MAGLSCAASLLYGPPLYRAAAYRMAARQYAIRSVFSSLSLAISAAPQANFPVRVLKRSEAVRLHLVRAAI